MKKLLFLSLFFPFVASAQLPDFSRIQIPNTTPLITILPTTLPSTFANVSGIASTTQSITYTFTNLTGSSGAIAFPTITGPIIWLEGSIDGGSTWHTSFSGLGNGSGTLQVRVPASIASGSYGPSNIVFTATGAVTQNCSAQANVSVTPSLSALPTSITGLNGVSGTAGTSQTVTITFAGTTITATAPTGTEVSKDGGTTYAGSQVFSTGSPLGLKIRTTAGASVGAYGPVNLALTGSGVSTVNVPISGTVTSSGGTPSKFAFAASSYSPPSGFTLIVGNPATGVMSGTSNGITFSTVATANWIPYNPGTGPINSSDGFGFATGSTATGFPDPLLNHILFNYLYDSASNGGLTKPQYQLSGFTANQVVSTITIVASINTSVANFASTNRYYMYDGTTVYVGVPSNGHAGNLYVADNNTSVIVTFTNVSANSSGIIKGYLFVQATQETCLLGAMIVQP